MIISIRKDALQEGYSALDTIVKTGTNRTTAYPEICLVSTYCIISGWGVALGALGSKAYNKTNYFG